MGSEIEIVEQRLNSFLGQLQVEFGILDRLVYKNKNQHRRCSYFQFVLKVRRDLRLLQSAHLEEIFSSCFLVIHGTRPKQKVQLLESLKKRKCHSGKHNFLERLLGGARLLSQILLDVVTIFNMVSSLSQKQQSVKLTQEGFEVFREYYPMNEQAVFLDCVWETDKFVLHESVSRSEPEREDREIGEESVGASLIQYQSIEVLLGDDEFGKTDPNHTTEGLPHVRVDNASSFEDPVLENDDGKKVEDSSNVEEGLGVAGSPRPSENPCSDIGLLTDADSPSCSDPLKLKSGSGKKVAFLSVNKPAASTTNLTGLHVTGTKRRRDEREDPFFDLLAGGNLKDSLF